MEVKGTLATLSQANTYSGKTSITGGTLSINSIKDVGSATASALGQVTTVANGTIDIGSIATGATLKYTGGAQDTNRVINLAGTTGGATLDQSAGSGLLKFTSAFTATGVGSKTLTLTGSTAGTGEISGIIANNTTTGSTTLAANYAANATTITLASVDGLAAGQTITIAGISRTIASINPGTKVVTLDAGAATTAVTAGASITSAALTNRTSVAKSGSGTWTLSGANTYTGGTTLQGGTLVVGNSAAFGTGAIAVTGNAKITNNNGFANNISISSGATLTLGPSNFVFNAVSGVISGDGGLTVNNNVRLTGDNTFKGNFLGTGGFITITKDAAFGASTNTVSFTGGVLSTYNAGAAVNLTRDISISGGFSIDINGQDLSLGGIISGTGGLGIVTTNSARTVTVSGLNTYTGATSVAGSTLSINSIKNVGGGASALGAVTTAGSGTIGINNATLKYTGTGDETNRVINLAGTTGGATLDQSGASGQLKFTSAFTATGLGNKTLTLTGSTAGTGEIAGAIVNSTGFTTSVTKSGTGTWTLTGTNTYTGLTSVNAGTLVVGVGGVGSITSNVAVASGATLGGSGTITGNVALNGGKLTAGNSPGTMTVTGDMSFNSGSIFEWELASNTDNPAGRGATFDAVDLTGATKSLVIDETAATGALFKVVLGTDFDGEDTFWSSTHSWDVLSVAGTSSTLFKNFALFNASNTTASVDYSTYGTFTYGYANNMGTLTWSAVPEPTSAMAGLLLAAGLLRRRRKNCPTF